MTHWNEGYVTDIGYTFDYFKMLSPLRSRLPLARLGLASPTFKTACELGFGQGLSANVHAAASITEWFGTDFNPSQANFAQDLARASGVGAKFYDEAFADFCRRADLPDFDYIGLHGIWSWISDENRALIVDFIRRKLKVGGILYVSYNTLPGWASFAPMRHLMLEHCDVIGAEGRGVVSRINDAIGFAERLLDIDPRYAEANPQIVERIKNIKNQNRNYLAHEYFNRDWHPMHFATIANWLAPAKVSYACSAFYAEHIDAINLTKSQLSFLEEIPDEMFRQSVRDFIVNRQFRGDYWVKGPRALTGLERIEVLRAQKIILTTPRAGISMTVKGSQGEFDLVDSVYGPILDQLADHAPRSLGQLETALKGADINLEQIAQAALILSAVDNTNPVQEEETISHVRQFSDRLNYYLMRKARSSGEVSVLASPVTGGGHTVSRFHQLFLLAMAHGGKTSEELARFLQDILAANGESLVKDGVVLKSADANLTELTLEAQQFLEQRLPILEALQVRASA